MVFDLEVFISAVILGTLAAVVYSLRMLVLMGRSIARIEMHIERLVEKVMKEEVKIERVVSRKK